MADNRTIIQLHKKGDPEEQWRPLTTGGCVQLTDYKNDGVTSGPIHNGQDDINGDFDDLNTALMKLENRPDFTGATNSVEGASGLVPKPAAGDENKFLKGDGTWAETAASDEPNDNTIIIQLNGTTVDSFTLNQDSDKTINISLSAFTGATNANDGTNGLVPTPQAGDEGKFLKGDGTWTTIEFPESLTCGGTVGSGVTINNVTTNATVQNLPTAVKAKVGYFYKVLGTYTYNGNSGKTGDVFMCAKTGSNTYEWCFIPSGDENYSLVDVGIDGLCPALPSESNASQKFLNGVGNWVVPENTTYSSLNEANEGTNVSLVTTGEKYLWNHKSNLALGNTDSTAAAGNHTHIAALAADNVAEEVANAIALAPNTTYKLTAGGQSIVFTTPQDANTTYSSLKNPYKLKLKANSEDNAFVEYDGESEKVITIKPATTTVDNVETAVNGAFIISDGTTSKTIQLAGAFTDTVTDVVDSLNSAETTKALSAAQGKVLDDKIASKANKQLDVEIEVVNGIFSCDTESNSITDNPTLTIHIDDNNNNTLTLQSGCNYTFVTTNTQNNPPTKSVAPLNFLDISTVDYGDLETNITFTLADNVTANAITNRVLLPANAKYVDAIPEWTAGHTYIISYYKGVFVFGEIKSDYVRPNA